MKYFNEIKEIIKKRSWKVYALLFGIFLAFFILAYYSAGYALEKDPEMVEEFVDQIKNNEAVKFAYNLTEEEKYPQLATFIFLHNSQIAIMNYVFGITLLLPLVLEFFNGMTIGFIFGLSEMVFTNSVEIVGFFIILTMEVVATTITAVEGMYLTYSLIRPKVFWKVKSRKESAKRTFKQSAKIILLALAILLLASIIETALIYYQYTRNVEPINIGL